MWLKLDLTRNVYAKIIKFRIKWAEEIFKKLTNIEIIEQSVQRDLEQLIIVQIIVLFSIAIVII